LAIKWFVCRGKQGNKDNEETVSVKKIESSFHASPRDYGKSIQTIHDVTKTRKKSGAPGGIRTHDQLIKSQLLYQLSYRGNRSSAGTNMFATMESLRRASIIARKRKITESV
jgi:hypothetical protein